MSVSPEKASAILRCGLIVGDEVCQLAALGTIQY